MVIKRKATGTQVTGAYDLVARAREARLRVDLADGKLYIDYLESMDELIPVGQGDEDEAEVREATSALA